MNCSSVQEIELLFLFSVTATSIFKTMLIPLRCTISLRSSIPMLTNTNYTTPNLCIKLGCIKKHRRLLNKLRIRTMRKRFFNCKQLSNTSWKKQPMLNRLFLKCRLIHLKPQFHKAVYFTKKKSMKKRDSSFKKLLTKPGINVIQHIILLYVTIK